MDRGFHSLNNPLITELTEDRLVLQGTTKKGNFLSELIGIIFTAGVFYMMLTSGSVFFKFIIPIFIGFYVFSYFHSLFINSIVVDKKTEKVQFITGPKMGIIGKIKEVNFSDITSVELKYFDGGDMGRSYWGTKIKTISSGDFQTFAGDYEPLPRIIAEKISKLTGKLLV
jgi:hypothetical protein